MNETLIQGAYIVAGLLFILALAGLSKHETAVMGNKYGIVGMAIALAATLWLATKSAGFDALGIIAVAMAIGAIVGIVLARKVEMTGMPELIAMLHSFVGLAAQADDVPTSLGPNLAPVVVALGCPPVTLSPDVIPISQRARVDRSLVSHHFPLFVSSV